MPGLTVTQRTHDRVTDLALAWGISEDAAILRLIDFWKGASAGSADTEDEVRVHAFYNGKRAEAIYHPSTSRVDVVSGPAACDPGLKPSRAAAEVVRAVNPGVNPARNGWTFWIVDGTGAPLQSLRPYNPVPSSRSMAVAVEAPRISRGARSA